METMGIMPRRVRFCSQCGEAICVFPRGEHFLFHQLRARSGILRIRQQEVRGDPAQSACVPGQLPRSHQCSGVLDFSHELPVHDWNLWAAPDRLATKPWLPKQRSSPHMSQRPDGYHRLLPANGEWLLLHLRDKRQRHDIFEHCCCATDLQRR